MSEVNILEYGDFGKQADDELALLTALGYEKQGLLEIKGVIGCYSAAEKRARLARSMLDFFGRYDIPVGVGIDPDPDYFDDYEFEMEYPVTTGALPSAKEVAGDALDKVHHLGMTLLLHGSMEDPAHLLDTEPVLFEQKVGVAILQAGVLADENGPVLSKEGFLQPDDSFNNAVAAEAAEFLYRELQSRGIPSKFISRHAIRDKVLTERLMICNFRDGNAMAETIYHRMCRSTQKMWETANLAPAARDPRHPIMSRQYFLENIVGRHLSEEMIGKHIAEDLVPAYAYKLNTYDPLTVLAGIPGLAGKHLRPYMHKVNGTVHEVVGLSPKTPNLVCPQKLSHELEVARIAAMRTPKNKEIADFAEEYSHGMHVWFKHQDEICPDGCDHSSPFDKRPARTDPMDAKRAEIKAMGPTEAGRKALAELMHV